jgi:hypothetical protein
MDPKTGEAVKGAFFNPATDATSGIGTEPEVVDNQGRLPVAVDIKPGS